MKLKPLRTAILAACTSLAVLPAAHAVEVTEIARSGPGSLNLVGGAGVAAVAVDAHDDPLVGVAARLFADDVERVTGRRPVIGAKAVRGRPLIVAGTLGHNGLIDELAARGRLKDLDKVRGRWEATVSQMVERPFPGVERAFVIVGSDRRGAAYGLTQLSERIGVSPWYWWADAPVRRRTALAIRSGTPEATAPEVKYRGIFVNDEDWGMHAWAKQTFEPEAGGIGPKTYEKIFELMLRLRLNTIWPAMHEVSREFHAVRENVVLADKYGIVAGASHCEPMLYNNVKWNQKTRGPWNYLTNRDAIYKTWEEQATTRGGMEGMWTLGIRGIHDQGMQTPPGDMPGKLKLMGDVIRDQRSLIQRHVTTKWGPVAQAFVPYKEVLPIYDAGLALPDDVTLVWTDDNFGYIRRLSSPDERKRAGGAGVYWHLSYYGGPHSYLWINSTAPALLWEELHKAWDNDARTMWMLNVGDLKPMEIGVDYFARFAWSPTAFGPDSQPAFLRSFAAEHVGDALAPAVADLLTEFYRLGTIRKPELMVRAWALSLPREEAAELGRSYARLLEQEATLAAKVPADRRDAYVEMIGFPARVLGATGAIFMADRAARLGDDPAAQAAEIARQRAFLEREVDAYNHTVANGKWKGMMPGLVTADNLMAWNSQVRWPWGEPAGGGAPVARPVDEGRVWRAAADADRQSALGGARWTPVAGLGRTGRAVALTPAGLESSWAVTDDKAPALAFDVLAAAPGAGGDVLIDFMPTFRIYPGRKLRVGVSVDDGAPLVVDVPGSSGQEDESGAIRREGVQNNVVRARVAMPALAAGPHVVTIRAIDPGVVIDRVALPAPAPSR
ncbi:glycosyl hydrolase 115 family protein [Telluria antibiotica]|nr:glycosyl hydrolase 115 family protein [Telluria antibiotica]